MSQLLDRYLQLERQTGLFWPRRGVIEDNHATKVDSMTRSNKTRPKAVNHQVVDRDTVNSSFHVFKRRGTLQLWFSIYLYVVKPTESKKKNAESSVQASGDAFKYISLWNNTKPPDLFMHFNKCVSCARLLYHGFASFWR